MRWFTGRSSNCLREPAGPSDCGSNVPSCFPTPKKISLECCARNPDPACRYFVWRRLPASTVIAAPMASRLLFCPRKRNDDRVAEVLHRVVQNPQLGSIPVFKDDLQPSVMVEIGESKGAAVLRKIQPHRARNLGKRAIAVVREHDISLVAVPGAVRADQFVDGIPSMLVSQRWRGVIGRFRYYLPPEKACEVVPGLAAEMYPLVT